MLPIHAAAVVLWIHVLAAAVWIGGDALSEHSVDTDLSKLDAEDVPPAAACFSRCVAAPDADFQEPAAPHERLDLIEAQRCRSAQSLLIQVNVEGALLEEGILAGGGVVVLAVESTIRWLVTFRF